MNNDRAWMYQRKDNRGYLNPVFLKGLENFMQYVISRPSSLNGTNIQCPCSKCQNHGGFWNAETVKLHLMKNGFVSDYYVWNRHGEPYIVEQSGGQSSTYNSDTQDNLMYNMVMDAAGPSFDPEMPNAETQKLYDILKLSERELYEGCDTSQLSAMAQMLSLKSDHHWSESCYDQTSQFFKGILPQDNTFLDSFYSTKKYMEELGLPSEQIDCCVNGCMLYWGEDINLEQCKFCSQGRYKVRTGRSKKEKKKVPVKRMIYFPLTPRLQRLYASPTTAAHMRWHAEHHQEEDVMRHCSDSEEWKQFDRAHPSFSSEIRNVRLGLSADGFQPFGETGRQYSSWPIIVTPYNLPPWKYSELCSVARSAWEKCEQPDKRISMDVYSSWIEFWKTPKFQKKSEIQKNNRSSGVDGNLSTHTSGSASHRTVAARAQMKYQCDPTADQIFLITHLKNPNIKKIMCGGENDEDEENGENCIDERIWVDKKSQLTYEKFERLCEEQVKAGLRVDKNALFLEAAGGFDKKKRVYGVGSSQDLFYRPETVHCSSSIVNVETHKLLEELEAVKDKMNTMENQIARLLEINSFRAQSPTTDTTDVDVDSQNV